MNSSISNQRDLPSNCSRLLAREEKRPLARELLINTLVEWREPVGGRFYGMGRPWERTCGAVKVGFTLFQSNTELISLPENGVRSEREKMASDTLLNGRENLARRRISRKRA